MKEQITDRAFNAQQRAQLVNDLHFADKCSAVNFLVPINEGEPLRFASILGAIFQEAGWKVNLSIGPLNPPPGLGPCAPQIITAFKEVGFAVGLALGDSAQDTLEIVIGRKP